MTPRKPAAPPSPTVDELREALVADRLEGFDKTRAARLAEHAAAKASGRDDFPTPISDWCETDEYKALRAPRNENGNGSSSGTPRTPRSKGPKATYTREGKPLNATHDSLSYMAYACTKNLTGEGVTRIGVAEFKEILSRDHNITDPEHSTWTVTLANGVTVGALMPGDQAAEKAAEVKAVRKSRKAAAKTEDAPTKSVADAVKGSTRASRKAAAPKATGTAKKTVTPRPKSNTPQTGNRRGRRSTPAAK